MDQEHQHEDQDSLRKMSAPLALVAVLILGALAYWGVTNFDRRGGAVGGDEENRHFLVEDAIPRDVPFSLIYAESRTLENYFVPGEGESGRESTVLIETTHALEPVAVFYEDTLAREGFVIIEHSTTTPDMQIFKAENPETGDVADVFIYSFASAENSTTTRISLRYQVSGLNASEE